MMLFYRIVSLLFAQQLVVAVEAATLVSTLIGMSNMGGFRNGNVANSLFATPNRIAIGRNGVIYITDGENHRIRQISPSGIVSTFAGNGTKGQADGLSRSMFSQPRGITIDRQGNIYVTDIETQSVRKITPNRFVTTVAGNGRKGRIDGMAHRATFSSPYGVTTDLRGNVYIADTENNIIRRITPDGFVTTFAGSGEEGSANGPKSRATFNGPMDLVFDSRGNLFVTDTFNHLIRRISPDGFVSTFAGSDLGSQDGSSRRAKFTGPSGLAIDEHDNLYISDTMNNLVRRITPLGVVTTIAGSGQMGIDDGYGSEATFSGPEGIAYHDGHLYVIDSFYGLVRKIKLNVREPRHLKPKPKRNEIDPTSFAALMRGPPKDSEQCTIM